MRLRLEYIANRIEKGESVQLEDMIWAEKLGKANRSAGEILRKARRRALTGETPEGGLDEFLNTMDLGDPDPSNHRTSFGSPEEIAEWFRRDDGDDWRRHD